LPLLRSIRDIKAAPVPLATRSISVRPSAGSHDQPVTPSLPDELATEDPEDEALASVSGRRDA
jgi:hypothetical protein